MIGKDKKFATTQLIRGCRGRCSFCELGDFRGYGTAQYSTADVLEEINFLVKNHGIEHIEWVDDDLLAKRNACQEIFQGIIDAEFNISWAQNVGVIGCSLDRGLVALMVKSGCIGLKIGIETGNEDILRKIRKPASKKKLLEVSQVLAEYPQIFTIGLYMVGFENETYGQIFETIRFAMELDFSWAMVSVLQVTEESNIDSEYELDLTNTADGSDNIFLNSTSNSGSNTNSNVGDYLPSPTKSNQENVIQRKNQFISAFEIFSLPKDQVHSRDFLGEIWFAFNLLVNFIDNKNVTTQPYFQVLASRES